MKHYRSRNSLHNSKIVQEWFAQFDARAEMVWAIGLLCRKSLLNLPIVQEWFSQYADHAWTICTIWRSCRNGLLNLKIVQECLAQFEARAENSLHILKIVQNWFTPGQNLPCGLFSLQNALPASLTRAASLAVLYASSRHFYFQNHPNLLIFLFLY